MARKKSSRKFQLTINNPIEKGYDHASIKAILAQFSLLYWCMCDEVGESGTYHTHIFFIAKNGVMFDTVKNRFYGAHIESVFGSNAENYNYIRKLGDRYKDKAETNLENTFEEYGKLPADKAPGATVSEEILEMLKNGCTDYEILERHPGAMHQLAHIERARQCLNEEMGKNSYRKLKVIYLWGSTGTGKTRQVMEKYGYANVYRVTDYDHPFDGYQGQDVVLFEEFRSSLKLGDMLVYLDGYPVSLPCRYANRQALFTKVYFATNIPLEQQYLEEQHSEPESYGAFLRRIDEVRQVVAQQPPSEDFEMIEKEVEYV